MTIKINLLFSIFTLLGLTACASQAELKLQTVPSSYHSQQCFISQNEGYIWLDQEDQWHELPAAIKNQMKDAKINWLEENALIVSLGQKSSAGYGIQLSRWLLEQNHWQVTRLVNRPAPDSMQAMMMTSPCVMVKIPKQVKSFSLLDEQGQALGRWPY